jgi:hypothetical protein
MVRAFHPDLLTLLGTIHQETRPLNPDVLARRLNLDRSTIYWWHRQLGAALVYYPHLAFARLGLTHLHLFVPAQHARLLAAPYGIDRA